MKEEKARTQLQTDLRVGNQQDVVEQRRKSQEDQEGYQCRSFLKKLSCSLMQDTASWRCVLQVG